jgi:hypothetical protein
MSVPITWFGNDTLVSISQQMGESVPTSAMASPLTGWTVGKIASGNFAPLSPGSTSATGAFATGSTYPGATFSNLERAWRSANTYSGSFMAGTWTFNLRCRASVSGADQAGRIAVRLFRSSAADGTGMTQITAARIVGGTVTNLPVTPGSAQVSVATFSLGAFGLSREYLYLSAGWEITVAGGANTRDVAIAWGNSGSMLISTSATATVDAAGNAAPRYYEWRRRAA